MSAAESPGRLSALRINAAAAGVALCLFLGGGTYGIIRLDDSAAISRCEAGHLDAILAALHADAAAARAHQTPPAFHYPPPCTR